MKVNLDKIKTNETPRLIARRDINIGRDLIGNQTVITSRKNTLEIFERLLDDADEWVQEWIDDNVVWVYKPDAVYQIARGDDDYDFTESWTQVYPDKYGSHRYSVNLKIHNTTIKQFTFIACDGGRISVPLPKSRMVEEKLKYFWYQNSIEFKVGRIIGNFYIYNSLWGVARMSKIEIL